MLKGSLSKQALRFPRFPRSTRGEIVLTGSSKPRGSIHAHLSLCKSVMILRWKQYLRPSVNPATSQFRCCRVKGSADSLRALLLPSLRLNTALQVELEVVAYELPAPRSSDAEMAPVEDIEGDLFMPPAGKRLPEQAPKNAQASKKPRSGREWLDTVLPKGASVKTNEGAGNCLFLALSQAVAASDSKLAPSHRQLRAAICAWMRRHADQWASHWDGLDPQNQPMTGSFEDYTRAVEKVGTWAGFLELAAFSKAEKRNLLVLDGDCCSAFKFPTEEHHPYSVLFFHKEHYEFVECDSGAIAELWTRAEHPTLKGRRGAAPQARSCKKSSGRSAASSLHLADFASQPSGGRSSKHLRLDDAASVSSLHLSGFASSVQGSIRGSARPSVVPSCKKPKTGSSASSSSRAIPNDPFVVPLAQVRAEEAEVLLNLPALQQSKLPRVRPLTKAERHKAKGIPTLGDTLKSIRQLKGRKQDIPYLQEGWVPDGEEGPPPKPVRPGARLVGLLAGLRALKKIREWEARDGDKSHQLIRISRRPDKRHSSWGCKRCAMLWPHWQAVENAIGDQLDAECHGKEDRINRLRSQSLKQWWNARSEVAHASAIKHLGLNKTEVKLLNSTYPQVEQKYGPPTRVVRMYKQAIRTRQSRQTPSSVKRAAPLVRHTAGQTKVKELLDRARKRLVEEGVERQPGPGCLVSGFLVAPGRAVFSDMRKQLLDRAKARLVEQGIEPHPGPSSSHREVVPVGTAAVSWPCEACGQVLWANNLTHLSYMRSRHISRRHPNVSKLCFRRLGRLREPGSPTSPPVPARHQTVPKPDAHKLTRSCGAAHGLSVVFLNAGGLDHSYSFLQQVIHERPHLIGVIECRAGEFQARKLRAHLAALGYRSWTLSNPPNRRNQVHTGLCFAVRDDIRAHVLQTHSADTGEFITLDLEILHITLVWQRPSEVGTSLGTELAEQAEGAFV